VRKALDPENTISAFKKAIEFGAHVVEMDVRETKDRHLDILVPLLKEQGLYAPRP
jgi:glycerophosphoryl diester phosphodiesterase